MNSKASTETEGTTTNADKELSSAAPSTAYSAITAILTNEVLVLDSSTFISEIGLMSTTGSALKHYLHCRQTQLVVPQAAAEEYKRNLAKRAKGKVKQVQNELGWLAQYFDGIEGWRAPSTDVIENRASALAQVASHRAILLSETDDCRTRARERNDAERPPAHKKGGMGDCLIWEQCLELLSNHDVIFVAADADFRSHRDQMSLHPQLRAEAEAAGAGRSLTFHPNMQSLLSEMKSAIQPIEDDAIFKFVYESGPQEVQEIMANTECRPKATGVIRQNRLTTDAPEIIEVRLEVEDNWESPDGTTTLRFEFSGSCRYHLDNEQLFDLKSDKVHLLVTEADGSVRAVKGSRVYIPSVTFFATTPPMQSKPGTLE